MASEGPEELQRMLSGLALDGNESDDALCPKCGLHTQPTKKTYGSVVTSVLHGTILNVPS